MELATVDNLVAYAPLVALVAVAAVTDVRARRIPNWLTFTVCLAGLAQALTPWRVTTFGQAVLGLLAGFALTFVLYLVGGRGAGDVKLTAGIGAWLGPYGVLLALAVAALVSLVAALVQSIVTGKLVALLRNTGMTLLALANVGKLGARHAVETGRAFPPTIAHPLPNAVSMLLGTVGVVVWVSRVGAG